MSELTISRVNGFRVKVVGSWLTGYRVQYQGVTSKSKTHDKLLAIRWGCYLTRFLRKAAHPRIIGSMKFGGEGQASFYVYLEPEYYWFSVLK